MLDELLEVSLRRLEGLLEGGRDLAIGVRDQAVELGEGGLQVGALLRELLHVLLGLGVLALGQRVHRAELLAAIAQVGGFDLGLREALGRGVKPRLKPRFRLRALA